MAEFSHLLLVFLQTLCVFIPSTSAFDPSISRDEIEENECFGTANGFSMSGTSEFRYNLLRKRYHDCTYVRGNLEITHLDNPHIEYDLSFLKNIRYVSGYVLIGLIGQVDKIPLQQLEIIRGNQTFDYHGAAYSLMVVLTSREIKEVQGDSSNGLTTLMMPKLKEITNGKVFFTRNPSLGYIDTIDWDTIVKGRMDAIHFGQKACNETASNATDPDLCFGGGMWGNDISLCQEIYSSPICDDSCGSLCFGPGPEECCHDNCAIGCTGPSQKECRNCKDFIYENECVAYCPALSYGLMQQCITYTPLN